jgi:hypothetical protein
MLLRYAAEYELVHPRCALHMHSTSASYSIAGVPLPAAALQLRHCSATALQLLLMLLQLQVQCRHCSELFSYWWANAPCNRPCACSSLQTGASLLVLLLAFGLMFTLQSLTVTLLVRKQSSTAAPIPLCPGLQAAGNCSKFASRSRLVPAKITHVEGKHSCQSVRCVPF